MAKSSFNFLHDINVYRTSGAYDYALNSPMLGGLLTDKAMELVILYQARVAVDSGKLQASAKGFSRPNGGKKNDRLIGVVTIADESVVDEWKGKPFYYGEYHEEGTMRSKRAKRRKSAGRGPRRGYHELREAAQLWRST